MNAKSYLRMIWGSAFVFIFFLAYPAPSFSQGGADRSVGDHEKPGKDVDKDKDKGKDKSSDKSGGNAEKGNGGNKDSRSHDNVGGHFSGHNGLGGPGSHSSEGESGVRGAIGQIEKAIETVNEAEKFSRDHNVKSREHGEKPDLNYHPSNFEPQGAQTNPKSGYGNIVNKLEKYVDKYSGWSPSQNFRIGVDRKEGIIGIRVGPPSSMKKEKIKEVELPANHCKSKGTPPPLDNLPPGSANTGGN